MISLYEAVCAQSNNYVAHHVSKQIDERQIMYCIENHCKKKFVSVRPSIIKEEEIKVESHKLLLIPPTFNLENLKNFVINSFSESVKTCAAHIRDPIGGNKSFLFV